MDVLAAILALQVKQLHDQFVGVASVDLALQKDDPILQQQIPEGHLTLALVALISRRVMDGRKTRQIVHGWVPFQTMGRQDAVYLSHSTGFGKATDKETAWQAAKFSEFKCLEVLN